MTVSRRDALRLATAAATTPAIRFAFSPEEAAALLTEPLAIDPGPGKRFAHDFTNPVTFAEDLDALDFGQHALGGAAEQWAGWKQAMADVAAAAPEAFSAPGIANPLGRLDDTVSDLATYAYWAGIRAGAAYEHLRLALAPAREVCRCNGYGFIDRSGAGYPRSGEPCPDCGGAGSVAVEGARRFAID
jgi:hypothetical protein